MWDGGGNQEFTTFYKDDETPNDAEQQNPKQWEEEPEPEGWNIMVQLRGRERQGNI